MRFSCNSHISSGTLKACAASHTAVCMQVACQAINHIRARKERFGVEVEQMSRPKTTKLPLASTQLSTQGTTGMVQQLCRWKDWQQRVAAKIREDSKTFFNRWVTPWHHLAGSVVFLQGH